MEKENLNWGGKREGAGRKEKKNKKITKSFALPPGLAEDLEKEAKENGISVSKLTEKIIRKSLEWKKISNQSLENFNLKEINKFESCLEYGVDIKLKNCEYSLHYIGEGENLLIYKDNLSIEDDFLFNLIPDWKNQNSISVQELLNLKNSWESTLNKKNNNNTDSINIEDFNFLEELLFILEFYLILEKNIQLENSSMNLYRRVINIPDKKVIIHGKEYQWNTFLKSKYFSMIKNLKKGIGMYKISDIPMLERILPLLEKNFVVEEYKVYRTEKNLLEKYYDKYGNVVNGVTKKEIFYIASNKHYKNVRKIIIDGMTKVVITEEDDVIIY